MKFQKVVRLRTQTHAVSAKHAERNEVKRSMISGNFEIFLIIRLWSTFIYSPVIDWRSSANRQLVEKAYLPRNVGA